MESPVCVRTEQSSKSLKSKFLIGPLPNGAEEVLDTHTVCNTHLPSQLVCHQKTGRLPLKGVTLHPPSAWPVGSRWHAARIGGVGAAPRAPAIINC